MGRLGYLVSRPPQFPCFWSTSKSMACLENTKKSARSFHHFQYRIFLMTTQQELHSILASGLEALSLDLTNDQKQQLVEFVLLIDKWNKAYNLTSIRYPKQMMVKHILDSLAIAFPDKTFTLLDSLGKRVRFMTQCVHTLKLTNVTPVNSRVENHVGEKPYDIVLSRAFASLKDMLHWCEHLVDSDGQFLALKGQFPQKEIDEVSDHFLVSDIKNITVPNLDGE